MARCALVSFSGYPATPSSLMPDNGLASLAAAAVQAGHEVIVLDLNTLDTMERLYPRELGAAVRPLARALFSEGARLSWRDQLRVVQAARRLERHQRGEIEALARDAARRLAAWRPNLVGLKLWNGDGFTGALAIARALRTALPDLRIAAGGPQVDYFGEHIHHYTDLFDVLIRGEGECAIVHLCQWADGDRSPEEVEGALWPASPARPLKEPAPALDLDAAPVPLYDPAVYHALASGKKIHLAVVEESRGCPQRCSFCIHPVKSGGRWRVKSAERVMAEIDAVQTVLGSRAFVYAGSNTPAQAATDYARAILDRRLDLCYGCFGHARGMQGADFRLLKESGCAAIFYGIESGSPRILRESFNKSATVDDLRRVLLATREAGIFTIGSVIFPAPFETAESRAETLRFLSDVRPDSVPVTAPGVIPGTPWHETPERFGFEFSRRRDLYAYGLTYKIRLLYPPRLWKPLPYRLNGKSSRRFLAETGRFIRDLEAVGILTNVPHELALMARLAGSPVRHFRDEARTAFFSGDVEWAAHLAEHVNRACRPRASAPTGPSEVERRIAAGQAVETEDRG